MFGSTRSKEVKGFTQKYNIDRLIYYETFSDVWSAIAREKQIKGWVRQRKVELIASTNPEWHDLSEGWYDTDSEKSPGGTDLSS